MKSTVKLTTPIYLENVPLHQSFYTWNGAVISNLEELRNAFLTMDNTTYSHHVNEHKNDFHNWIKDVIHDDHLAEQLLHSSSREEAASIITSRIAELQKLSEMPHSLPLVKPSLHYPKKSASITQKKISVFPSTVPRKVKLREKQKEAQKEHKHSITPSFGFKEQKINEKEPMVKEEVKQDSNMFKTLQKSPITNQAYTSKQILLEGLKDFFLGLFIGIAVTLIVVNSL